MLPTFLCRMAIRFTCGKAFSDAMDLNSGQEVHLSHYWNVVYKRWKIATAVLLVVMTGTFLASYFSPPQYRSAVTIQIERENPNQLTFEDLLGIAGPDQEFMQTQYILLKSRGLAERAIKDQKLLSNPDFYPAGIAGKTPNEIQQIQRSMSGAILGGLDVTPVRNTSLVEVGFVARTPQLAQKIAEGIADSYIRMNAEKKLDAVRQASDFLTEQIATLKGEI